MSRPDFVVTGSTVWACEQIASYLKPELEGTEQQLDRVQTVERHIGKFETPADVKRWIANRDGGIRIAAIRVSNYESIGNRIVGTVSFVAYVFTTDQFGYQKDTRAEVIAGKLAGLLLRRGALPTAYSKAESVRGDNLYSAQVDELGLAVWAVSWTQQWYLDVEMDLGTLDDFLRFGIKAEVADDAPQLEGVVDVPQ